MKTRLKKKELKNLLTHLRIKIYGEDEHNYRVRCFNPTHLDRNPSCYIRKDNGIWHCWSCEAKGNLYVLFRIYDRNDLMAKYFGTGTDTKQYIKEMLKMGYEKEEKEENVHIKLPQGFSHNFANTGQGYKYINYLRRRGLKWSTIKHFKLGYTPSDEIMKKRIIIPIYDGGKLRGYQGRSIKKHPKKKYRFPKGVKTGRLVFNIDNIRGTTVIITEGVFEVMMLSQWGYNAISLLGLHVNQYKVKKMLLTGINTVVLAIDPDEAADMAKKAIYDELYPYFKVYKVELPPKKDVDELKKCEFDELYSERKLVKKKEWVGNV